MELLISLGVAAVGEIREQGKNRKVEGGVDADGDAEKPAERPGKRFVRGGHDEFRKLQTGRKKGDKRDRESGFTWHREGQGKKSHQQADYRGQNQTEEWALRHQH